MSEFKVYIIKNTINDCVYIGQTTESLEQRFKRHIGYQLNSHKESIYFYRAMYKLGKENFYIELLDDSAKNQEELTELEYNYMISYAREKLYNTSFAKCKWGGDTLSQHPDLDNIKKTLSECKKGEKNPRAKKIKMLDTLTGEETIFNSVSTCQAVFNELDHTCITRIASRTYYKTPKLYLNRYDFWFIIN